MKLFDAEAERRRDAEIQELYDEELHMPRDEHHYEVGKDCLDPDEKRERIMRSQAPLFALDVDSVLGGIEDKIRDHDYRGPVDPGQLTD